MRVLALSLLLMAAASAQAPSDSLTGTAMTVTRDQIVVQTAGTGATLLYSDYKTKVWRGQSGNALTAVQPGDNVLVRYRQDSARLVIVDLWSNITHVWGRVTDVTKAGFEVDQNFDADPQSGYSRRQRQITFNSDTEFEASVPQDLRVGRTVDIVGVDTADSGVQAARVTVCNGNAPVRLGAIRIGK
jgi:hypothetical protein